VKLDRTATWLAPWAGHAWTIAPSLRQRALPRAAPESQVWSTTLSDPKIGQLTLRGALRHEPDSKACLLVVHGLGGAIDRPYCIDAAQSAQRAGISCLRFGLRGADRGGEDFYHAGLIADVEAAVASQALAEYERLYVLGYSLGGHVTLRYALSTHAARVRAVAAVCAPLDLDLSAQWIDRPQSRVYRGHVLAGLNEIYAAVSLRHAVPTPLDQVRQARSLRVWDSLTVVPRFGFGSVDNYYSSMSVGPRLLELKLPSLLIQSTHDPMVPPWTYERHLLRTSQHLDVQRLSSGGHVAFPNVRLGNVTRAAPLSDQIIAWLRTH
jgi:predicted alpha/beta-fold hydrolase